MKLTLSLSKDQWDLVLNRLNKFRKDSETIDLVCLAIESQDFEQSFAKELYECLTSNGVNPFRFPKTTEMKPLTGGHRFCKRSELAGKKWQDLEPEYYAFLLQIHGGKKK